MSPSSDPRLVGRSIVVLGAAGGIGEACVRRLAREGAQLLLADLDGEAASRVAASLGVDSMPVDVTRSQEVGSVLDRARELFGRVDVLFNATGVQRGRRFLEFTEADWDFLLDTNLKATFFAVQAASRRMVDQSPVNGIRGRLIQTASVAAYRGGAPAIAPYAAAKAGVISITRSAAQALAPHGILSNCVCPGVVATPMWESLDVEWSSAEGWSPGEAWRRRIASIPLGRPEQPDDVAGVVAFLASDDANYMTGQAINVDGGLVMGG